VAVHAGEDDECVHGKLKEDKLRRRCRGTSLQASNGETPTSPRTEAWPMMELGFFSLSSSNFFWRWSTKTVKQLARCVGEAMAEVGLGGGLTKASRRKRNAATLLSSKAGETWQWKHRRRVSLFIVRRNATVIPTD
jgi:hypothetical protein